MPLITGMFQSSSTTSGAPTRHAIERLLPVAGLADVKSSVSRICRATLRITLESSTTRQVFIDHSLDATRR